MKHILFALLVFTLLFGCTGISGIGTKDNYFIVGDSNSLAPDGNYLRLDTANGPLTGNLEIDKEDPSITLTDNDGDAFYIEKIDGTSEGKVSVDIGTPGAAGKAISMTTAYNNYNATFSNTDFNSSYNFSASMWAKFTSSAPNNQKILTISGTSPNWSITLQFGSGGSGSITAVGTDTAGTYFSKAATFSKDTWHHVVLLVESGSLKVYVDNSLVITQTGNFSLGTVSSVLGCYMPWTTTLETNNFDEYNFFASHILTSDEITELYNSSNGKYMNSDVSSWDYVSHVYHFDDDGADEDSKGTSTLTYNKTVNQIDGPIGIPAESQKIKVWNIIDGLLASETGIITFGNAQGSGVGSRTILDGQSIRFNQDGSEQFQIDSSGDLVFPDNYETFWGTGKDSSITDTGSLMTIDPDVNSAGSRYLFIDGQTLVDDKIMFTQTDGNEYIDSLADGYLDLDATTGIRLRVGTTIEGTLTSTALDLASNNLTTTGIISGNTITDGTATLTGGSISGGVDASFSDTVKVASDLTEQFVVGTLNPSTTYKMHLFDIGGGTDRNRALLLEYQTAITSSIASPFTLKTTSTGNMIDGFGGGMLFAIQDTAGAENFIARISAQRNGADNSGRLNFDVVNAGGFNTYMYIDNAGHRYRPFDNVYDYYGAGNDASIYYDGTDLVIDSRVVGTGDFHFTNGDVQLIADNQKITFGASDDVSQYFNGDDLVFEQLVSAGAGKNFFRFKGLTYGALLIEANGNNNAVNQFVSDGIQKSILGYSHTGDYFTFAHSELGVTLTTDDFHIKEGDLYMPNDNKKFYWGAGNDASIYYNGTNLVVNPQEVGSGILDILNDTNIEGDLNVLNNANVGGDLNVTGDLYVDGNVYSNNYYGNKYVVGAQTIVDGNSELVSSNPLWDANLVGVWHLNGDVNDSSGLDRNGSMGVAGGFAAGLWGTQAGNFTSAASSKASIPYQSDWDFTSDSTLSFWVYPNSGTLNDMAISKNTVSNPSGGWYAKFSNTGGFWFGGTGAAEWNTGISYSGNQWQHFVLKREGNTMYAYKNGGNKQSQAITATYPKSPGTPSLMISGFEGTDCCNFDGRIEEVVFWDDALSDAEISELYNSYTIGGYGGVEHVMYSSEGDNLVFAVDNNIVVEVNQGLVNIDGDLNVTGTFEHAGIYGQIGAITEALQIADQVTVSNGTITSGDLNSTWYVDNNYLVVNETGQWKVDFNFYDVPGHPATFIFTGYYNGNPAHNVYLYGWNYDTNVWERLTASAQDFPSAASKYSLIINYPADNAPYFRDGNVRLRISHDSVAIGTHNFYADYVAITYESLALPVAGTYYQLTDLMAGYSSNMDINGQAASMTISKTGAYQFIGNISFAGTGNAVITGTAFVNGINPNVAAFRRKLGASGDVGSAGGNTIMRLNAGDVVTFWFASDTTSSFISVSTISMQLNYLGR